MHCIICSIKRAFPVWFKSAPAPCVALLASGDVLFIAAPALAFVWLTALLIAFYENMFIVVMGLIDTSKNATAKTIILSKLDITNAVDIILAACSKELYWYFDGINSVCSLSSDTTNIKPT